MNPELLAQLTLSMSTDDSCTPSWLKVQINPDQSTEESQKLNPWAKYPTTLLNFKQIWRQIVQAIDVKRSQLRSILDKLVANLKNQKFSPIKS